MSAGNGPAGTGRRRAAGHRPDQLRRAGQLGAVGEPPGGAARDELRQPGDGGRRVPVLLPPVPGIADVLDGLDALVLSGGADLDPAAYGAAPHPHTGPVEPGRDAAEFALLAAATGRGLPVLAICRGLQILNVSRGGTLHQHLPDLVANDSHRATPGSFDAHPVRVAPDSRLGALLGPPPAGGELRLTVPTSHHQAIGRLGDGLVASAWADDGTIEAAEPAPVPAWPGAVPARRAVAPGGRRRPAAVPGPGRRGSRLPGRGAAGRRGARRPAASRLACVSTGPAVEISNLVKCYGRVAAVNGLSLQAARGAVTAILGPNGAGKTTTIEICEGYRRADEGTVRVLGLDPARDAARLRPRVGVMLQSGGIPTSARPAEYLRVLAAFYAHPLDPGMLLERLGLTASLRTTFRRLSGGQQQRLSLAAAVIGRPELVFLDEPTAGLDPQARLATWELISGLRSSGASVILTTHYMDEAQRLADRVCVVDHGQLVADGSPAELTGTAGQLRFRAEPGLDTDALIAALPRGSAAKESPAGHYIVEVHDRVDPQLLAAVTAWCADHGVLAQDLRIESRTLEDVFLELTGRELRS